MLASIAPEILCQTEKIAPGAVAMDRFEKAVPARDVASPEFCIPISIDNAFLLRKSQAKYSVNAAVTNTMTAMYFPEKCTYCF